MAFFRLPPPRPRPRINPRMIDAFDAPNGGVGAERVASPFALDSSGPKHFYWLSLLSYVHVFIGLHLQAFFQGRESKEWCDCYRSCISDCETYCCHRRKTPSFLGNDGSPFLDSGFHKVMYCSQPTERRCCDADRSLLPEPDPLRRRLLVVGQRQLVSLAPIDVVAHRA